MSTTAPAAKGRPPKYATEEERRQVHKMAMQRYLKQNKEKLQKAREHEEHVKRHSAEEAEVVEPTYRLTQQQLEDIISNAVIAVQQRMKIFFSA